MTARKKCPRWCSSISIVGRRRRKKKSSWESKGGGGGGKKPNAKIAWQVAEKNKLNKAISSLRELKEWFLLTTPVKGKKEKTKNQLLHRSIAGRGAGIASGDERAHCGSSTLEFFLKAHLTLKSSEEFTELRQLGGILCRWKEVRQKQGFGTDKWCWTWE